MNGNGWRALEEWEIRLPSARGSKVALLDTDGEVIAVGQLFARGADNHWLIEPLHGYPQYIQGIPAIDGRVEERFNDPDNFIQYAPRADRLQAAKEILDLTPPPEGLGDFYLVELCRVCKGYRIERIFQDQGDIRKEGEGIYYLNLKMGAGLSLFLRPDRGSCSGH